MDVGELQRLWVETKASVQSEGFLNRKFDAIQGIGKGCSVVDATMYTVFLEETVKHLNELRVVIQQHDVNFKKADSLAHKLKIGSTITGADRLKNACISFLKFCNEHNIEACKGCLHEIEEEYTLVKIKLQSLFSLKKQILEAGGSIP